MCGRFTLTSEIKELQDHFKARGPVKYHPSYNISPSHEIPVVRGGNSGREIVTCRWGLVPHWSKPDSTYKAINARAETLAKKPYFRDAYRKRRCLIPANGFYEWKQENHYKQPCYFRLKDENLMGFAGLWEYWEGMDNRFESCTIITTTANAIMKPVHDRMPVIISPKDYELWLGTGGESLLAPYPGTMYCHPVSTYVNNPKNDGKDLIEPKTE
jgi:putative SOS response-associated peptidase YedK